MKDPVRQRIMSSGIFTGILLVGLLIIGFCHTSCDRAEISKIDLAGSWRYRIDSLDTGRTEQWYAKNLKQKLILPGSLTTNGLGNEVSLSTPWTGQVVDSSFFKDPEYEIYRRSDNFKIPFWLQPIKYYRGAVWYQKKIRIPGSWDGRPVILFMERCHWESRLWIDDVEIGMQNSLGTPHQYDLSGILTPGVHTLTICVDNRIKDIDPGINSHSISDHTQTNWNGIIGEIYLKARPEIYFESVRIKSDIQKKSITVDYTINNLAGDSVSAELSMKLVREAVPAENSIDIQLSGGLNYVTCTLTLGDNVRLWDEFSPELYTLRSIIRAEQETISDSSLNSFGMRSFRAEDGRITVNNRPVFLRGTLELSLIHI